MDARIKKYIFVFLAVVLYDVLPLVAQEEIKLKTSEIFDAPLIGRNYVPPPKGEGSPYLYDNWVNGYIVFISGDTVKNKLLKFDCMKNECVWMADGQSLVALDHSLIKSFALFPADANHLRTFERANFKLPLIADSLFRYLEVLSKGKFSLYAFRRIEVESLVTHGISGGLYQVNSYLPGSLYYLRLEDLPVVQVRMSKRSIYEAYPQYKDKIKRLMRANHRGSIRNEYQLAQVIKVINENWEEK